MTKNEGVEERPVFLPDAVVDPRTVMVELTYTPLALVAVPSSIFSQDLTLEANIVNCVVLHELPYHMQVIPRAFFNESWFS